MTRYLFEYEVPSTGKKATFSWIGKSEEEARAAVHAKVADFEFMELDDIVVGKVLEAKETTGNQYYECEGCSA
ncbi:hypothetical protein GXP70_06745 [Paenibacillus lycopersici]|uniref:Uncharacterized protein n=1 Tax=Paenibacillus lycopersici TaxID=2704462 RepID=A0A6C0FRC5_9BACL|nr:hypothetical protein [Paenibacillus lycopersici]QHT59678.1 hypothetical protein GXP70_06745 [Paenibacillus lycopersici]